MKREFSRAILLCVSRNSFYLYFPSPFEAISERTDNHIVCILAGKWAFLWNWWVCGRAEHCLLLQTQSFFWWCNEYEVEQKKKPNCVAVHWKHLPARHHNIFINTICSLCKYTPYIHFTSWWRIVLLSFMFCRCRHNFIIYSITSAWDLIKWLNFGCSPWREAGSESQWERRQIGLDYIASAETETSQLIPLSLFGLFFCVIGGGVKLCAA